VNDRDSSVARGWYLSGGTTAPGTITSPGPAPLLSRAISVWSVDVNVERLNVDLDIRFLSRMENHLPEIGLSDVSSLPERGGPGETDNPAAGEETWADRDEVVAASRDGAGGWVAPFEHAQCPGDHVRRCLVAGAPIGVCGADDVEELRAGHPGSEGQDAQAGVESWLRPNCARRFAESSA